MTAADARLHLDRLVAERDLAVATGLHTNATYMDDLAADLASSHEQFVLLAVTEIATLRAELDAPLVG
jgi:hypothetical protein